MYRVCYKNRDVQYWMYVNDLSEADGKDVVGIHEFNPNTRWKSFTAEELRLLLKTGSLNTEREVEGRGRLNAEISYELDCRSILLNKINRVEEKIKKLEEENASLKKEREMAFKKGYAAGLKMGRSVENMEIIWDD